MESLDRPKNAQHWYSELGPARRFLDRIYRDERGRRVVNDWFSSHALDLVSARVSSEADCMVKAFSTHKSVEELTPDFLRSWSLQETIATPANDHAPYLLKILRAAMTSKASEKNKKKFNETVRNFDSRQIISRRSQYPPDFAGPMSLMWWASGCSREAIEILANIGLSKGFDTTQKLIRSIGNYCIADARVLARGPDGYLYNYDNVNLSTSIFVEQCSSSPAKVQSGTYTIIYRLRNPNPCALNLSIILQRAQNATDLNFNRDLCPSFEQSRSSHHQFCSYLIRVLCRYENTFQSRRDDVELTSPPRRCLPAGYKTVQLPLKICTKEESSIKGNLASLNRGAKAIRMFDVNPFLRCQNFQLGIGLFHLCLNFAWALLNVHRGHVNHHGTLAHMFAILEKVRLGGQKPDYHSLVTALMQILDGLVLDAWRIECGYHSLAKYAESKPSAASLRAKAATILYNHATPDPTSTDTVRENTRRLIHDLLYLCEVTRAIAAGDFGRVEDILTTLGMMFRGAGSKNYSTEIMHFTHNMKKVWNESGFE
ncbi:hypothetical protein K438DRAFT_1620273 [Mycena galopus ATCC 62051]|nr:hypothetical protein K438DRAFT_1620273 [Mycena galopus ATCC 62051]